MEEIASSLKNHFQSFRAAMDPITLSAASIAGSTHRQRGELSSLLSAPLMLANLNDMARMHERARVIRPDVHGRPAFGDVRSA